MPQTLIVAQVISVTVILGSVLALRSAEKARAVACEHLAAKVIAAKGSNEKTASQLEMMLDQVKELKDGAFAPLSSQRVVKAVLLPLLSYGATLLAHLYAVPGV